MAPEIRVSRLIRIVFGLVLALVLLTGLVNIVGAAGRSAGRADIVDFHAFYLVGQLIWSGRFADAYHWSAMLRAEEALGGRPAFMPWSYPPLFGVVVAGLAALPLGAAYLLFAATTLALYLWAMWRLDAENRWPVMLASVVSIVLNLRCGQNGLFSAGLVAAAARLLLDRQQVRSASCLAVMAMKPHLIPLVPLVLILQRRWVVLVAAGCGAAALTALSLAIFGRPVFVAFLGALPDAGRLMALGAYPMHRMTSVFAFCIGIGLPAGAATLIHAVAAVLILTAAARLAFRHADPRLQLGLAIMAGLFVSPYVYDYDQVLFGVGLILANPALRHCLSARRYLAILVGYASAQSLGLLMSPVVARHEEIIFSPMGPAMLAVLCCVMGPLWRAAPMPSGIVAAGREAQAASA